MNANVKKYVVPAIFGVVGLGVGATAVYFATNKDGKQTTSAEAVASPVGQIYSVSGDHAPNNTYSLDGSNAKVVINGSSNVGNIYSNEAAKILFSNDSIPSKLELTINDSDSLKLNR